MADSPGSPLSSLNMDSPSEQEDAKQDALGESSTMPRSKRRRTGIASWDRQTPLSSLQDDISPPSPSSSISSDTSGELPSSPRLLALIGGGQDDDYSGRGDDQVTVCQWEGCDAGDLGNMDELVRHVHDEHIGSRQKKYSCEWVHCVRKGQTHASGYALRAHMRSHTREKPFYCALPECDKSFTRSDALTKHMRTVHESDALRPSDFASKHHPAGFSVLAGNHTTPASKLQRIKLKLSQPPKDEPGAPALAQNGISAPQNDTEVIDGLDAFELPDFEPELGLDRHELSLPPRELYRLLRRQIHWAEKESAKLRDEWATIAPKRRLAWHEKEAVLDDVLDAQISFVRSVLETDADQSDVVANIINSLEKFRRPNLVLPDKKAEENA